MKYFSLLCFLFLSIFNSNGQGNDLDKGQTNYVPTKENLQNREWFKDAHFGMFIHWGVSSGIGQEIGWALSGNDVNVYRQNMQKFNPVKFDAAAVVKLAKDAGMKYITFTTRHHDSFSMFNTKYSDWGIMNTPYGKDVLKMLADECHKQGIRLFCYYSLTDFYRPDYCQGNQKKGIGIQGECNWEEYLQFMNNQLTEILTNYGTISGIWFDGHWDQVNMLPDNHTGTQKRCWKYDEIYGLIHRLQPGCMIVNNHHLTTFSGEDYQTFERDLPGENVGGGFSSDSKISNSLPLEMSEIIGKVWGYAPNDTINRSTKELIQLLIKSAGLGSNFLLNTGPGPDGEIRQAHQDRMLGMGSWLNLYGETIYGTRKSWMKPANWGVAVEKGNQVFLHIINPAEVGSQLVLKNFPYKLKKASRFESRKAIQFTEAKSNNEIILTIPKLNPNVIDQVFVLEIGRK